MFRLAGGILTGYNVILTPAFHSFGAFTYAPTLWLISAAAADVLISGGLVWFLAKNKAGFARTRSLVDKIIISSVQSGIVTSLVAITTLVIFLAIPVGLFLIDLKFPHLFRDTGNYSVSRAAAAMTMLHD